MSFSTNMQAVSQRLLSLYGQVVSVTREVEGSYNPETGESPVISTTTYQGWGNPSQYTELELLNTNILESDTKLYFYSATRPKLDDAVTWDDEVYRVQNVNIISAQGNDCLYELQLRIG